MNGLRRIGTITEVNPTEKALLVRVSGLGANGATETLVHDLSGDDAVDQSQISWYMQAREGGAVVQFECTRSSPFTALRIERAAVNQDAPEIERQSHKKLPATDRVSRGLDRASGVLQSAAPRARGHGMEQRVSRMLSRATEVLQRVG